MNVQAHATRAPPPPTRHPDHHGRRQPGCRHAVLTASAATVDEDHSSALSISLTNAADLFEDGNDSVSVTIHGLPAGAVVKQGAVTLTADGSGDYHLTATSAAGLAGVTVTPPTEFEGAINFTVSAQAHDGSSASSIVSTPVTLTVNPHADTPVLVASAATVDEDHSSALSISLTTPPICSRTATTRCR